MAKQSKDLFSMDLMFFVPYMCYNNLVHSRAHMHSTTQTTLFKFIRTLKTQFSQITNRKNRTENRNIVAGISLA